VIDNLESATSTTSPIADQRPRPPTTKRTEQLIAEEPLENCCCRRRCADRPILVNVWRAIWVAHGH